MKAKLNWSIVISIVALAVALVNASSLVLARNNAETSITPTTVSYQGQVTQSGQLFNGTGYFKFAIVNNTGDTTYWSNDGTSTVGSQPDTAISLAVSRGLFSIYLGDTSLPGMTQALQASAFAGSDRALRVWFSSDNVNFNQLSPDRKFSSVPFALQAENAGTLDGFDSAIFAQKDGTLQSNLNADLLDGKTSSEFAQSNGDIQTNLNADLLDGLHASQMAIPTGAIILGNPDDANLIGAGFTPLTRSGLSIWRDVSMVNTPGIRYSFAAFWTGDKMLVWGGSDGLGYYYNSGSLYDPQTDTWTPMSMVNAPAPRMAFASVWTGTDLIVWGGYNGATLGDGARYNLATDTWSPINPGAILPRYNPVAVWTGTEMIVWGGIFSGNAINTGGRYNPTTNSWIATNPTGDPAPRYAHTAVWTGTEMIIWGGYTGGTYLQTGARYNPQSNTWIPTTAANAPVARGYHSAVWTGTEMIVWGGYTNSFTRTNAGARYIPGTDNWTATSLTGAPDPRDSHVAVWTGEEMVIFGGWNGSSYFSISSGYLPDANAWILYGPINAPSGRVNAAGVWTGNELIFWGGNEATMLDTGGVFNPYTWFYAKQ